MASLRILKAMLKDWKIRLAKGEYDSISAARARKRIRTLKKAIFARRQR